jgi:hypothetical protein
MNIESIPSMGQINVGESVADAAVYSAGVKAGYNQCRTEAAIRIGGLERDYDSLKRTHDASITVIRDMLKDVGANLSELPSVKRAHDLLEQVEVNQ